MKYKSKFMTFALGCLTFPFSLLAIFAIRYYFWCKDGKEKGKGIFKKKL